MLQLNKLLLFTACLFSISGLAQQAAVQRLPDSTLAVASEQYSDPALLQKALLGANYRKVWSTPVSLPVFDLKSSGLTVTELGGGMQTKSLRLKDKDSVTWVLRTVDKDADGAVPTKVRNKLTVSVVQQLISASYPYASLTVASLAKKAGVKATDPQIFWVPDEPGLGEYRKLFANTVCLFERKDVTDEDIKVSGTDKTVKNLLQSNDYRINQQIYLRARLLDMLIADWDRHADQWAWAARKAGQNIMYEALPKDRDQAFFYSKGLLVKLAAAIKLKHLVGFTHSTGNLKKLSAKSWNMDKLFLNGLSLTDWKTILQKFCNDLPDEAIADAVKKIPAGAYAMDGEGLTAKLISRRNGMLKDVLEYYRFLSKEVSVYGTDDAEIFEISGDAGKVSITIRAKKDRQVIYQRTFDKKETDEIRLFALGGDDLFQCADADKLPITVSIDKGKGNDQVTGNKGKAIAITGSDMDADESYASLKKKLKIKD